MPTISIFTLLSTVPTCGTSVNSYQSCTPVFPRDMPEAQRMELTLMSLISLSLLIRRSIQRPVDGGAG
jgi:hypothetical protein